MQILSPSPRVFEVLGTGRAGGSAAGNTPRGAVARSCAVVAALELEEPISGTGGKGAGGAGARGVGEENETSF